MELSYKLLTPSAYPASSNLLDWLNLKAVRYGPDQPWIRIGAYLGQELGRTIVTTARVSAVSVFCWDEMEIFDRFQDGDITMNFGNRIGNRIPGDWKAESYGYSTKSEYRVARWVAWDEPVEAEEAHAVYDAISPIARHKELMKLLEPVLLNNLVGKDPNRPTTGAYVAVVAGSRAASNQLMDVVGDVFGEICGLCMKEDL